MRRDTAPFTRTPILRPLAGALATFITVGLLSFTAVREARTSDTVAALGGGTTTLDGAAAFAYLQCELGDRCTGLARFTDSYRNGGLHVLDPVLAQSLDRLHRSSPTVARWLDELEREGLRVFVGRRGQVPLSFGPKHLALSSLVHHPLRLPRAGAVIAVDIERVRTYAARADRSPRSELDATLAHELAHVAVREVGPPGAAACPDPAPGQPYLDSCIGRWDNRVRADIGAATLTTYGGELAPTDREPKASGPQP